MTGTAEMREQLLEIIAKEGMIHREKLIPTATLETIGLASYDIVMILMAIEEKYGVYLSVDSELSDLKTLDELLNLLATRIEQQQSNPQPVPEPGTENA
jgi:acyl carrier protein